MGVKYKLVVFVTVLLIGVNCIQVQLASTGEAILGIQDDQARKLNIQCAYTLASGESIQAILLQYKDNNIFRNIALVFEQPSLNTGSFDSPGGDYLKGRVNLTQPTSASRVTTLSFSTVKCEDEKEYNCKVIYLINGNVLEQSSSTKIIVKVNPEEPDSLPVYVPSTGIEEGNNVVFTCTGNVGKPHGKFRWVRYRRNSQGVTQQETPYESETTTYTLMPGTCTFNGTSKLTLKMEHIDNNAVVRCQVVYQDIPEGSLYKQTFPINVYYSVRNVQIRIFPINITFVEGTGPITLTCSSDGNPAVISTAYTWYKESHTNMSLGTGPTYVINNVVVNETDNYICIVQNSFNGQTFNTNYVIHIQIDFSKTTYSTPLIWTRKISTKRNSSSKKRDKDNSAMVISILIALVAALSVLQLGEIICLYILHKKGIVTFKTRKEIKIYEDINSGSTDTHVYSSINRAAESERSMDIMKYRYK